MLETVCVGDNFEMLQTHFSHQDHCSHNFDSEPKQWMKADCINIKANKTLYIWL